METIKQILIILLAAGLIFAMMLPLAQTDWADEVRNTTEMEGGEGGEGQMRGDMPASLMLIMGFLKETIIMLVSGVITLGIYRLIKRSSRRRKVSKATG